MLPRRILVGYDGSKESEKALDAAVDLAKASGGGLIVQHVIAIGAEAYVAGAIDVEAIEAAVNAMLDQAVGRARTSGVAATKVVHASPVPVLVVR